MAYQPIYVLSEGHRQTRGRDAQHMNIAAGDLSSDDGLGEFDDF